MPRVCIVVGARPNFMKAAPVHAALSRLGVDVLLVHTGQHYDTQMSDVFLSELGLPQPDVTLGIGSGTHGEQTARALTGVEAVLLEQQPDLVVVAGDVNSTLAGALAAVKVGIPLAHVEAGLRSFDRKMPEEHNRRLTDHLSDVLLTHSEDANVNLQREGIAADTVHLVGNTMIDSVLTHLDEARARRAWAPLGLEPGGYGLVTLHRPALVDDPATLSAVTDGLVALAEVSPIVFPVHPRTVARLGASGDHERLRAAGVRTSEALGYLDFLCLQAEAAFVVTDSGGVQEETSSLGVRCFTLRDTTERPVTVALGTNTVLGAAPGRLAEIPLLLEKPKPGREIPLWDGRAGERAAAVLQAAIG